MKYLSLIVLLAAASPALAQPAAETPTSTETKAEAYYYFCLGRMDERNMSVEDAIANYERASQLDPEAGYPHVALAENVQVGWGC